MKPHVVDTPIYTDEELLELWEKYSDQSKGYYDGPPSVYREDDTGAV